MGGKFVFAAASEDVYFASVVADTEDVMSTLCTAFDNSFDNFDMFRPADDGASFTWLDGTVTHTVQVSVQPLNIRNVKVEVVRDIKPEAGFENIARLSFEHDVVFDQTNKNIAALQEDGFCDNFPFEQLNVFFNYDLTNTEACEIVWEGMDRLLVSYH